MKKFFLIISLCLSVFGYSQGENDNWYFGNLAAVNFSNIAAPATLNNSQMITNEASGTVSDANGNLLFYCSPKAIWNRQHQIMQNGNGLVGGLSAQQLAIVKNPANPSQYYVFVTPEVENPISPTNSLSYSIVDMSLGPVIGGSPLGAVLQNFTNIPVLDNLGNNFRSEAITIVAGTTANTYWLLIPSGNNLYSYQIDSNGFSNGSPVISNLNFPVNLNSQDGYSIKASPKLNNQNFSNFICISLWQDNSGSNNPQIVDRVVSFDSTTGSITNNYSLNVNGTRAYLPEFNSNGSVLFLANTSIFAVDLLNSTTASVNSMQILTGPAGPSSASYTSLQRNKHGNIYINRYSSSFLGIINNPDVYGSNMSVTLNSINLGAGIARYGLPQLIPEANTSTPCTGDLILTSEPNLNFFYQIGNTIVVSDNYVLGPRHNITMQAGQSISLLPGTHIGYGSHYYGFIAPCGNESVSKQIRENHNQREMVLNLDMEERKTIDKQIEFYPNPVSDILNIKTYSKIKNVFLFDMSGKRMNVKLDDGKVDVKDLPAGTYLINVETSEGVKTEKFIKK